MERLLERGLFASRWLMAPMYVGLIGALILLLYAFAMELVHLFTHMGALEVNDIILGALALIDLSLAGNLILIVIFSGYENFVSKLDAGPEEHRLEWHGTVDFSGLKLKLIASIVAISGIHLLKTFINAANYSDKVLIAQTVIHITFLLSAMAIAYTDRLMSSPSHRNAEEL